MFDKTWRTSNWKGNSPESLAVSIFSIKLLKYSEQDPNIQQLAQDEDLCFYDLTPTDNIVWDNLYLQNHFP